MPFIELKIWFRHPVASPSMHETKKAPVIGIVPNNECKDSVINVYIFRFPQLGKRLGKDWEEKEKIGKKGEWMGKFNWFYG